MKSTSIRDLHIRTSELVREAEEGTVIVIERRGEPVAELHPISKKRPVAFPDMTEFLARMPQVPGDSGKYLEEIADSLMYFDSAYVAKVYLKESDSDRVRELARTSGSLVTSTLALCEVQCTFHRHMREGFMTLRDCDDAAQTFQQHVDRGVWRLMPVTESLLKVAGAIVLTSPRDVFLRAADALHLATARQAGEHEVWTNDRRMLAAAPYFGVVGRSV